MQPNRLLFTFLVLAMAGLSLFALINSPAPALAQSVGPTATAEPSATVDPSATATLTATATMTATPTITVTPTMTGTPFGLDNYLALVQRAPDPTATPTVTPSPTPLPECNAYFDDFSNPDSGWSSADVERYRLRYISGEYEFQFKAERIIVFSVSPADAYENYEVETNARWNGEIGYTYGVIFGITPNNVPNPEWYLFEVYPDGQLYAVTRWRVGQTQADLITQGNSDAILTGTATNNLRVVVNGNQQAYYINDVFVTTTNTNQSGARWTGLAASTVPNPNANARFDDFCITTTGIPNGARNAAPALELEALPVQEYLQP